MSDRLTDRRAIATCADHQRRHNPASDWPTITLKWQSCIPQVTWTDRRKDLHSPPLLRLEPETNSEGSKNSPQLHSNSNPDVWYYRSVGKHFFLTQNTRIALFTLVNMLNVR